MASIDTITRRLATHQAALATAGIDPAWDCALQAYLRADALQHADLQFGARSEASETLMRRRWSLEGKYGKAWHQHPDAQADRNEIFALDQAADKQWTRAFCAPFWRASRELALTPAPTMAAALFKAAIMEADELSNDTDFPADCMEVLQADFRRLARETAQ